MQKIKILITGGAGYVGSVLSHHLTDAKLDFIIIDRKPNYKKKFLPKKIKFYSGDFANEALLKKIYLKFKPTHIVHLAALTNVAESEKNKYKYNKNNIQKSKKFFNFFLKRNIGNIIFASTAAVYSDKINKKRENSKEKPANYYGYTKQKIENFLKEKINKSINITVFRFFNIIGSDFKTRSGNFSLESKSLFNNICRSIIQNKPFYLPMDTIRTNDGSAERDFIDVNDVIRIMIYAIKNKTNKKNYEIINVGTGKPLSVLNAIKAFKSKIILKKTSQYSYGAKSVISDNRKLKNYIKNFKFTSLEKSAKSHYTFIKKVLKTSKL